MKISATLKNDRGGQKVTADDTRILVDLKLGNKLVGTIGFYVIKDDEVEGCRVIWNESGKGFDPDQKPILEIVKGKQQTGEKCGICGKPTDGISCCIPL